MVRYVRIKTRFKFIQRSDQVIKEKNSILTLIALTEWVDVGARRNVRSQVLTYTRSDLAHQQRCVRHPDLNGDDYHCALNRP